VICNPYYFNIIIFSSLEFDGRNVTFFFLMCHKSKSTRQKIVESLGKAGYEAPLPQRVVRMV
jgi:hypothetical protein